MSAATESAAAWADEQLADVEYATRTSSSGTATTRAVWHGDWYDHRTGFRIPADYIRSVHPLYLVSLDAAIEAAAEHHHATAFPTPPWEAWSELAEDVRELRRAAVRESVTAAVMGGAQ